MSVVQPDRPSDRFRRSAVGSVVAAGLLGLRDALEGRPETEETVLDAEAPGAPPPDGIELYLDPDHPERSVAVIHLRGEEADRGE
jgi:hypothetical protein